MIRRGKSYRRRVAPHTIVTVIRKRHGMVTYHLKGAEMTISAAAFREIYRKVTKATKRRG